jgi:hypothetical protein
MPISYRIDHALNRIVVTLTDPFDITEVEVYNRTLFADPQFKSGYDLLADMRIQRYNLSAMLLRGQAERAGQLKSRFSGRQALVCHDNRLLYGMARLYEVFSRPFGLDVRVFTTEHMAEGWLDDCQKHDQAKRPTTL